MTKKLNIKLPTLALLISFSILGGLLISQRAYASQDVFQLDGNSSWTETFNYGDQNMHSWHVYRTHAYAWMWLFDSTTGNPINTVGFTSCGSGGGNATCTWNDFGINYDISPGSYYAVESYSNGQYDYGSFCGGNTTYSACSAAMTGQPDFTVIINGDIKPQITFLYPTNGTTSIPFSPWQFQVNNLVATHSYTAEVHWYIMQQAEMTSVGQIYADYWSGGLYNTTNSYIGVPRQDVALNAGIRNAIISFGLFAQNVDPIKIHANAYLRDLTTDNGIAATSSIEYWQRPGRMQFNGIETGTSSRIQPGISPTGTLIFSTSTSFTPPIITGIDDYGNSVQIITTTSTAWCTKPTDNTDIGGGIAYAGCTIMEGGFKPHQAYSDAVGGQVETLKTRFPINTIVRLIAAATSSLANPTGTYGDLSMSFPAMYGQPTTSFAIANSHILADSGMPSDLKDKYFDATRNLLWLGTAIAAITVPFML